MAFNKEDLAKHKMLRAVILKGEFKINGEAVTPVAALFQWYDDLESKIKEGIPQPIKATEVKDPMNAFKTPKLKKTKKKRAVRKTAALNQKKDK